MGARNAKADLKRYRDGYPGQVDNDKLNANWRFYAGQIESEPDGDYIDVVHEKWRGNYAKLEVHHGYIQWLFPIREHGMNSESQPLQLHEVEKMKADPQCIERFLKSYEMQLHFYGCVLDRETGKLSRGDNWESQYRNLNTHSHNFLRITRILKSLGELGFEHYKKPFLDHFAEEIWLHKTLSPCGNSCRSFWIGTLKDEKERKAMKEKIGELSGTPVSDSEESSSDEFRPPSHRHYTNIQTVGTQAKKTEEEIEAERLAYRARLAQQSTKGSAPQFKDESSSSSTEYKQKFSKYMKYIDSSDESSGDDDYEPEGDGAESDDKSSEDAGAEKPEVEEGSKEETKEEDK